MSSFSGNPSSGRGGPSSSKKNKGISGGGFQSLGLSEPVYRGIVKMGFRIPTPVQRKSLPVVLSGSDTVVMARTGSGKTAAFLIPVLERLLASRGSGGDENSGGGADRNRSAGAVILSPTRELSLQTLRVCRTLSSLTNLKSIGINGGESMEKQFSQLSSRPDIVVATPGRLAHHLSEIPDFHLKQCEVVVFDEADRLFEMGFAMQIRQICSRMPGAESGRQTLLFSATMPKVLVEFTKSGIMGEPEVVRLDSEVSVSAELRCGFITVRSGEKDAALLHLLRDVLPSAPTVGTQSEHDDDADDNATRRNKKKRGVMSNRLGLTLIFAATRHHVDYLTTLLNTAGLGLEATGIYGTMDQVARKENLARFRTGETPILVVTDVAARGIDVPLIDHVIHYAFPPSAKLFVHRSGRAARAGRIGYCWGIVDSEELPYMVDLHVFLGRKLSNGTVEKDKRNAEEDDCDESNNDGDGEDGTEVEYLTYNLAAMTPDMVHYGCIPELTLVEEVENVRRIADSEMTGSHDAEALRALTRVCNNAMKQYRRSRPEASKAGVRRAKALLEGAKDASGKRIGEGIKPHPLLKLIETEKLLRSAASAGNKGSDKSSEEQVREKLNELKKRDDFLRAMNNFRPKETIFEAFATGKEKAGGVHSQVDRGRTDLLGKKADNKQAAFGAMKSMRRQMKMARDKGSTLVVAGSRNALALNGEEAVEDVMGVRGNEIKVDLASGISTKKTVLGDPAPAVPETKRRLSKAERKRLKKNPRATAEAASSNASAGPSKKNKNKRGADFRDVEHYIDNEVTLDRDAVERSRQIEAAMQPSASGDTKGLAASALKLEQSMLDIVGDEREDLVKRQRMMRWDKSKRKYVQISVGDALSGESRSRKIRLESGQLVESKKIKLGELYEKWQKKTNKSVGRVGVFDDVTADDDGPGIALGKGGKGVDGKYDDGMGKKKSAAQIRKEREAKDNMKRKNMKKEDRRRLERRDYTDKTRLQEEHMSKATTKAANRGKKGPSGRWANTMKKRR
eukprot:CAMPEP_0181040024 /NCGR_PEP_ID=MMETSP1070-20121207/10817_1 /TAXON_ID=265543 /ORGANISM="Minutocellus polymorphus, Strain NH13" /LENGTH=1021 /DNA_ID=CAMNT_0023117985 /DNA_START=35 /DNA_END=3100 /DNA_ORIENTATION=-